MSWTNHVADRCHKQEQERWTNKMKYKKKKRMTNQKKRSDEEEPDFICAERWNWAAASEEKGEEKIWILLFLPSVSQQREGESERERVGPRCVLERGPHTFVRIGNNTVVGPAPCLHSHTHLLPWHTVTTEERKRTEIIYFILFYSNRDVSPEICGLGQQIVAMIWSPCPVTCTPLYSMRGKLN